MKNKILLYIFFFIFFSNLCAENLNIEASKISLDKDNKLSIFENNVKIVTEEGNSIKSDFATYNKKLNFIQLKKNITATDLKNNIIKADYAEYDENKKIFKTKGLTKIFTPENYIIETSDILFNNSEKFISSDMQTKLIDQDNNQIYLDNFRFDINKNIFKSVGEIKIQDISNNSYEFSQIYIDTKKKEILGTDIKAYLNSSEFKINKKNQPRVFANTINFKDEKTSFGKSIFTLCNYRKNDKCPPWTMQSSKMLHDNKSKTIYYNNAILKVYNIPIFYFPKLSHPDPSVKRRSGFLVPSFNDSKNLGGAVSIPYFFDLGPDKNFTLTNQVFFTENPLFQGEYHQAFKNSDFLADFGYTEGYKKSSSKKKSGDKSHLFAKFIKNFNLTNSKNNLDLSIQHVSDDKYLKLYKIRSNLVDYNNDTLESSLNFSHESDDMFLGVEASVFETLKENYNDKYEYIFPELTLDKNLFSNEILGNLDLTSNIKVHNYDTNKLTSFLVNDFNWMSKNFFNDLGIKTNFLSNIRNINYEVKNVDLYKEETTNEFFGSLGVISELDMQKNINNNKHFLTPKLLLKFSPGQMRKENEGTRLNPDNAFSLNRLDNLYNYETGLSAAYGFDYKRNNGNFDHLKISLAQILNKKENKQMASITSLDEKLSDIAGTIDFKPKSNLNFNYNFSLDQNYKDLNYNELETNLDLSPLSINFNYIQEKKHIGNQDYFKTKINFNNDDKGLLSFETKRNLITNSSEFYDLSYEYINDCLRAGLVYRREFYNDSELEPENSLMFKITLSNFGNLNSPKLSQ